jgi:tetratricopeptide (TPR) repeat protein
MKSRTLQQRREAGLMLMTACEEVLGVTGPTALAKLTGRSKGWWSKLNSGVAAFPTWEEVEELLPPGLSDVERERLHLRYRQAWLWRYDPVLIEQLDRPVAPQVRLHDLCALRNTSGVLAYHLGDHYTALRLTTILELLLVPRGIELLPPEELAILQDCLNLQSVCERELGHYETAIAVAQRSVKYQQTGGSHAGELLAQHALGLALQMAQTDHRPRTLAQAAKVFEDLHRECQRLGMTPEAIRAQRDLGITWLLMGRAQEAEAELRRAYEVRPQSADSRFRSGLWLVDVSLQQGKTERARQWLTRTEVIARHSPDEIGALMAAQYMVRKHTSLKHAVAVGRSSEHK